MFSAEELQSYVNSQSQASIDANEHNFDWFAGQKWALSSAVDLATSVTDSLTLGYCDNTLCDTGKALKAVDEAFGSTVSQFYENNQNLVHMTSFIAGAVAVPGAIGKLASKTLKGVTESGTILPKIFTGLDRSAQINKTAAIASLQKYGADSIKYKEFVKSFRTTTIAAGIRDALLWESAFYATMNGHPYMEDNYGPIDFAIGASIGSMVGPIKYGIARYGFYKEALDIEAKQYAGLKNAIGSNIVGETKGHTLTNLGLLHNHSSAIDVSGFNQTQLNYARAYTEDNLVAVSNQIDKMVDGTFEARRGLGNKGSNYQNILKNRDYGSIYDASSDQMILSRMTIEAPGVFTGVNEFSHVSEAAPDVSKVIRNSIIQHYSGEMHAVNGSNAAKSIAPRWGHDSLTVAKNIEDFDDTIIHAKVTIGVDNINGRMTNTITIPNSKLLKDESFQEWAYKYLNTGDRVNSPVIIKSADGHLTGITDKILRNELNAEMGNIDILLEKGFITPNELDKITNYAYDYGVINKYFGHEMMPSTLSRLAQTASADSRIIVNKQANSLTKWDYKPFETKPQVIDGMFLEAGYAVNNDKKLGFTKKIIDGNNLPEFQAATIQMLNKSSINTKGIVYKVKIGDNIRTFDINSIDTMVDTLLQQKMNVAKEMVEKGGMYNQAAIYTNLTVQDIEAMHTSGWNLAAIKGDLSGIAVYTGKDITKFHKTPPIAVYGKNRNFAQLEDLKAKSVLDLNIARDTHNTIIRNNVESSNLRFAKDLLDNTVFTESFTMLRDNLEHLITTIYQPTRLISSADHALRQQGQLGEIAVTMGQNFVNHNNAQFTDIGNRVKESFAKVAQNRVDTLQFEQLKRAIQADRKHYIDFDPISGKFPLKGEIDPTTKQQMYLQYLKNPDGSGGGDIIASANLKDMMRDYIPVSREMYDFHNLLRRNDNLPPLNDRGIWFPYEAVEDKFIAFQIHKKNPSDIFIVTANSADSLKSQVDILQADINITKDYDIVTRQQLGQWSDLLDLATLSPMQKANVSFQKSGIAVNTARPDASGIDDLLGQLQSTIWRNNRVLMKQAGAEVFQKLEEAAKVSKQYEGSAGNIATRFKRGEKPNTAEIMYSTMLNTSLLPKYHGLMKINDWSAYSINKANDTVSRFFSRAKSGNKTPLEEFQELGAEARANNIPIPWTNVDDYLRARGESKLADMSQHRVAQINGISATMNLRFMDLSHAAITLLSTPVILSGELAHMKYPMKMFMDTAKFMLKGSQEYKDMIADARKFGYVKSMVSEATDLMSNLHTAKSLTETRFKNAIKTLSSAADWSEQATREYSYTMGYLISKSKGVTDKSLLRSAAHNFTIRTMGNYISRQRPTLFQGSFGSIIGLYQTFMLTMGQNVYRYAEAGNTKALATLMGAQAGMFGLDSMPMYHPFNRILGSYTSQEHNDLNTIVYDAFGNNEPGSRSAAEFLLFGVPSTLFRTGIYTRGELQPRAPVGFEGGSFQFAPPAINNLAQVIDATWDMVNNVGTSIGNKGGVADWYHATLQSFAAQSIWRPGARWAELLMGNSYDRKGEKISGPEDVYGVWPIIARVMGSRPLKEQTIRNMKFNGSYYNTVDLGERKKIIRQVRRLASQGGDITGEQYETLMNSYLDRGGSPTSWGQTVKKAFAEAQGDYADRQMRILKNQEGYLQILEDYGK